MKSCINGRLYRYSRQCIHSKFCTNRTVAKTPNPPVRAAVYQENFPVNHLMSSDDDISCWYQGCVPGNFNSVQLRTFETAL